MEQIIHSPMFGILLTLLAFEIGILMQKKTKLIACNSLLIAIIVIIIFLLVSGIKLEQYQIGGNMINMFLGPATVVLAVPLYQQVQNLKDHFLPIMIGIMIGIVTGMASTLLCSFMFQFDIEIIASLIPKSITTPIGIELSGQLGGLPAITVMTILITGIFGAVVSDVVFRFFHIDHPIAKGVSLGTSAHAVGTTKALQLGSVEGAMSSLAIGVSGIITVFIAPLVWQFIQTFL